MTARDRAQTWFREVIVELRGSWRPDLPWDGLIALREQLQRTLDEVVALRHQAAGAGSRCSHCGGRMRPVITVRAVLLALGRFGIESADTVGRLDKAWAKHRALHRLDMFGCSSETQVAEVHAPRHSKGGRMYERAGEQGDAPDERRVAGPGAARR